MNDITLEKIDEIRERTGVSYTYAKKALDECNGDIIEALVYIEKKENEQEDNDGGYTTKKDFLTWIKQLILKGQATRIKIKREDKVIVDIPVNAGIAASIISVIWWPIAATLVVTAAVTKITIEITKEDGSVEIVNKNIKNTASKIKDKFSKNSNIDSDNVYQYKVDFEDVTYKNEDESKNENNNSDIEENK